MKTISLDTAVAVLCVVALAATIFGCLEHREVIVPAKSPTATPHVQLTGGPDYAGQ